MQLNKQQFIDTINAIKSQHDYDIVRRDTLSKALECEVPLNDNSRLLNQMFRLLQSKFPPSKEGVCEIQDFCYALDFGRHSNQTAEDLWNYLIKKQSDGE